MAEPDLEWRNVWSKSAKRVGYEFKQAELYVEWLRNGKISIYGPNFPYELFDKLSKAPSVGNMMRDEIAPKYKHRYSNQ